MAVMEVVKSSAEKMTNLTIKHSPAILTGLGIIGIGSTVIFAVKATPKAMDLIDDAYLNKASADHDEMYNMGGEPILSHKIEYLGFQDTIKATWKCYIPATVMSVFTILCFVGSNRVNAMRTAALSSAYSMTEKALQKYEEKVVDILGKDKNDEIQKEIIEDEMDSQKDIIIPTYSVGSELCYDCLCGQYFWSDRETIREKVNDFNKMLLQDMYGDKNEWFLMEGCNQVEDGDLLGWNSDKLLDVDIKSMVAPNGKPCLAVHYCTKPSPYFRRGF